LTLLGRVLGQRADVHDRRCTTVLCRTIQCISRAFVGSKLTRHAGCIEPTAASPNLRIGKPMGTELLIAFVSVLLFGLCALFVRICDRI
jgi:hypothetical protein